MTTLLNRDVFYRDPDHNRLDNNGVSQVGNSSALLYELRTFVCEGEYADGLERMLDAYLSSLDLTTQKSAWVSGFFTASLDIASSFVECIVTPRDK